MMAYPDAAETPHPRTPGCAPKTVLEAADIGRL